MSTLFQTREPSVNNSLETRSHRTSFNKFPKLDIAHAQPEAQQSKINARSSTPFAAETVGPVWKRPGSENIPEKNRMTYFIEAEKLVHNRGTVLQLIPGTDGFKDAAVIGEPVRSLNGRELKGTFKVTLPNLAEILVKTPDGTPREKIPADGDFGIGTPAAEKSKGFSFEGVQRFVYPDGKGPLLKVTVETYDNGNPKCFQNASGQYQCSAIEIVEVKR